jgi:hypothetical protein
MRETERVTVILEAAEYARLCGYCQDHGYKKSTLIARIIRDYLDALAYPTQQALELSDTTSSRRN